MEISEPKLNERVVREKVAYDEGSVHKESGALQTRFQHVFLSPNSMRGEHYLDQSVAQYASNRDILDYGCYDGWMMPRYLKMNPRSITGLDISETGIARAIATYGDQGNLTGDAHHMPFDDASFDVVTGRGILHHLDLKVALQEIHRILRPGGAASLKEPLRDNPGAKVLRALTPKARTPDERPLTRADIQSADLLFGGSSHLFYNLFTVPVGMLTSLTPMKADNFLLQITDISDHLIAKTPLKYWMRGVVLVWHKN